MKITFISNYYNHHQSQLCGELFDVLGKDFIFIQTKQMDEERIALGWEQNQLPFYVKVLDSDSQLICMNIISNSDIVIYGSADYKFIKNEFR